MGNFKRGLLFGSFLGMGLMWLNTTKKGKAMRDEVLGQAADIYEDIKDKVMTSETWDTMTKNKYIEMVRDTVDRYAVQTGLSDTARRLIERILAGQWGSLERDLKHSVKRKRVS